MRRTGLKILPRHGAKMPFENFKNDTKTGTKSGGPEPGYGKARIARKVGLVLRYQQPAHGSKG